MSMGRAVTIKFNENSELRTYYLIDGLELPENTNYLILESLTYLKDKQNLKNVFVVKLQDSEIKTEIGVSSTVRIDKYPIDD